MRELQLATYLRLKRQLLQPEMIGLPEAQRDTADLLHRAAIAAAAGVSLDDYNRLDYGARDLPAEQVLHALIDVLELTEDDAAELERIVRVARDTARTE